MPHNAKHLNRLLLVSSKRITRSSRNRKTEFISAFVHYLFHHQLVKNILVVSQSHEAVNTTVERIRQRFTGYKQDVSIVRISNKA